MSAKDVPCVRCGRSIPKRDERVGGLCLDCSTHRTCNEKIAAVAVVAQPTRAGSSIGVNRFTLSSFIMLIVRRRERTIRSPTAAAD